MSIVTVSDDDFQHILRMINTNIDGRLKVAYALTAIKGVGRRFAAMAIRRANVDITKRAGELTAEEVERLTAVLENPAGFDIPAYLYNRQKDRDTSKSFHLVSSTVDTSLRNDLERMKRNRVHRGMRHHWNLRVRGQCMCTNARHRQSH